MTRFFRSGIYEYEKRKIAVTKPCADCGTPIPTRGGKLRCLPCYDAHLMAGIARRRHLYARKKETST